MVFDKEAHDDFTCDNFVGSSVTAVSPSNCKMETEKCGSTSNLSYKCDLSQECDSDRANLKCYDCPSVEIGSAENLSPNSKMAGAEFIQLDKTKDETAEMSAKTSCRVNSVDSNKTCTVKSDTFRCVSHNISWSDISTDSESEEPDESQAGNVSHSEKLAYTSNCWLPSIPPHFTPTSYMNDSSSEGNKKSAIKCSYPNELNSDKSDWYKCIQGNFF